MVAAPAGSLAASAMAVVQVAGRALVGTVETEVRVAPTAPRPSQAG